MEDASIWQILRQEEAPAEEHHHVVRFKYSTKTVTKTVSWNRLEPAHRGTKRPSDGADILAFLGVLCLARSTLSLKSNKV